MFRAGSTKYLVKIMPDPIIEDGEPCDGLCHARSNTIQLSPDLPVARRFFVMCHEVMHAWLFSIGNREPRTVEACCDLFATAAEQLVIDLVAAGGVEALIRLRPGDSLGLSTGKIALMRTRFCPRCNSSVALGQTEFKRARNTPDLLDAAMWCEFCDVTFRWQERSSIGGVPTGEVVSEQSVERGNTLHLPDLSREIAGELA